MFNALVSLGWGIVTFAIVVGVGTVVLGKLSSAMASCPTGFTYQANSSGTTYTNGKCCLNGGADCSTGGNVTNPSSGSQATYYMEGQLGTTGLSSWAPAIIALSIGLLFLGSFMINRGKQS